MATDDDGNEADVIIVGDGPTGLSAALLLAKNGQSVRVFGNDDTKMHMAHLWNYLGAPDTGGTAFMERAREQVVAQGADLVELIEAEVSDVKARDGGGFVVTTDGGQDHQARRLVLATGTSAKLAERLELEMGGPGGDGAVRVDLFGRTSREGVHAGGWLTRGPRIQAAISVGDGAAIALDILSDEKGKPFHDFDVPPDA